MALTESRREEAWVRLRAAYDDDLYTWAFEQADLVEDGHLDGADLANIAEELRTLGRSQYRALESALCIVLLHILKWDHQPERRTRGWALSIAVHRGHAARELRHNPGLKSRVVEAASEAYETARLEAARETGLHPRAFPEACPYDLDAIMHRDHPLPEAP